MHSLATEKAAFELLAPHRGVVAKRKALNPIIECRTLLQTGAAPIINKKNFLHVSFLI